MIAAFQTFCFLWLLWEEIINNAWGVWFNGLRRQLTFVAWYFKVVGVIRNNTRNYVVSRYLLKSFTRVKPRGTVSHNILWIQLKAEFSAAEFGRLRSLRGLYKLLFQGLLCSCIIVAGSRFWWNHFAIGTYYLRTYVYLHDSYVVPIVLPFN